MRDMGKQLATRIPCPCARACVLNNVLEKVRKLALLASTKIKKRGPIIMVLVAASGPLGQGYTGLLCG